jgi:hypothetical protein
MENLLDTARIVDAKHVYANLTEQDLHMYMSLGFIVRSRLGTLVNLRAELQALFHDTFTKPILSSSPLFVVHWNDLTPEAQSRIAVQSKR